MLPPCLTIENNIAIKKKILIYDNDEDIIQVCTYMLERNGYFVETKTTCDDVLLDALEIRPDLIFLDLLMQGMERDEAIKLLKQNPVTKRIPVLLFSANDFIEKIAMEINADGFIRKPFGIDELLLVIEETLNAAESRE